jgi:hypothetical protein
MRLRCTILKSADHTDFLISELPGPVVHGVFYPVIKIGVVFLTKVKKLTEFRILMAIS